MNPSETQNTRQDPGQVYEPPAVTCHKLSLITLGGTGGFLDPGATEPGEPSQPGSFDDEDDYEGNDWG